MEKASRRGGRMSPVNEMRCHKRETPARKKAMLSPNTNDQFPAGKDMCIKVASVHGDATGKCL
jgi:hypothetical protein